MNTGLRATALVCGSVGCWCCQLLVWPCAARSGGELGGAAEAWNKAVITLMHARIDASMACYRRTGTNLRRASSFAVGSSSSSSIERTKAASPHRCACLHMAAALLVCVPLARRLNLRSYRWSFLFYLYRIRCSCVELWFSSRSDTRSTLPFSYVYNLKLLSFLNLHVVNILTLIFCILLVTC